MSTNNRPYSDFVTCYDCYRYDTGMVCRQFVKGTCCSGNHCKAFNRGLYGYGRHGDCIKLEMEHPDYFAQLVRRPPYKTGEWLEPVVLREDGKVEFLLADGKTVIVHWECNMTGEEMPPYKGWYDDNGREYTAHKWRPINERE